MKKCVRTVYDFKGVVETIEVETHAFHYTGRIPCTGRYACMYCGKTKTELKGEEN